MKSQARALAGRAWRAVRRFTREWSHDNAALLAGGVAFYAIFSLAPLLALLLYLGATVLGAGDARERLIESAAAFTTPRTAEALAALADAVQRNVTSEVSLVSGILLLLSASAVFRHLRAALNIVLGMPASPREGWARFLISRLIGAMMVAGVLIMMVATVVTTSVLAAINDLAPALAVGDVLFWRVIDLAVSTCLVAAVFTITLKVVPDVTAKWKHVACGAIPAAVLFSAGRFALAAFLGRSDLMTAYGAAASLAVVLVAVYFAVVALFVAAELTELARRSEEGTAHPRGRT